MGLGIYLSPDINNPVTSINTFTITLDGRYSCSIEKQIFIHNDDKTRYYTNVYLQAVDTNGITEYVSGNTEGFSWKAIRQDAQPYSLDWARTESLDTAILISSSLGSSSKADIYTYISVWIQVNIPKGQSILTYKDIVFRLNATELLVG